MKRYFQLVTHLAFPQDLISIPPGKPGDVVELDAERCQVFGRFLRLRVAAGDLVELDGPSAPAGESPATALASPVADPPAPSSTAPVPPAAPKE